MTGCDLECGAAQFGVLFIVAAQSPIASPASEDLLDEPTLGKHVEAFGSRGVSFHDMELDTTLVLNLALKIRSGEAAVSEHDLDVAPPGFSLDLDQKR